MLAVVFYLCMGVVGAMFEHRYNAASLVNPLAYASALCANDPYMNPRKFAESDDVGIEGRLKADEDERQSVLIRGTLAEGLLALCCFGLAYAKWRKTREDMLREAS